VLHYTVLEGVNSDKHSGLLGPFESDKENIVLGIRSQGPYSQHFIFFVTYKWAQQSRVLHYTVLEGVNSDKHSGLLGPFETDKENKVLRIQSQGKY
jgi:hypothetical protein